MDALAAFKDKNKQSINNKVAYYDNTNILDMFHHDRTNYSLKYHVQTIFEYGKHAVMWVMVLPCDTSLYHGIITEL